MFMKKISLVALAVVTSFTVMAQETGRQQEGGKDFKAIRTPMAVKTRFGIMGGINSATFNDNKFPASSNITVNSKTSLHFGVLVNVPIGNSFRFQPALVYNGFGSKVGSYPDFGAAGTYQDYELDAHYLSLPLLLQLQSKSGFFVEAGPQVGYLLMARQDGPGSTNIDLKDKFDKLDVGATAGLGYLTRIGLGLKADYYFGLANILDEGSAKDGPELKNRAIQIGLVYHFGAAK